MQKCKFIMDTYNLTQGYEGNTYSHNGTYAMDICGKDGGIENAYAPFDCYVSATYIKSGVANTVWYTSNEEVMCADGVARVLTLMLVHDNDISDMWIGRKFKQGEVIFQEGTSGNATGNHIHMELGKGICGWHKNNSKTSWGSDIWVIDNQLKPDEMMFANDNTIIKNVMYLGWNYSMKSLPKEYNYRGYVDGAGDKTILGWAYNSVDDTSLEVKSIILDSSNNQVGESNTIANVYREDLKKANIGNGCHGFVSNYDFNKLQNGTYTVKSFTNNIELQSKAVVIVNNIVIVPVLEPVVEPKLPIVDNSPVIEVITPSEPVIVVDKPIIEDKEVNIPVSSEKSLFQMIIDFIIGLFMKGGK